MINCPGWKIYFDGYYRLQKTAIEVMTVNLPNEPIMEDYLSLFPNADVKQLTESDLRDRFLENIQLPSFKTVKKKDQLMLFFFKNIIE